MSNLRTGEGPVRGPWPDTARWANVAVITVTAAVGAVAAVISYAHQHALNLAHEASATAWTARAWPVTVEGIVLAAGLVLVIRRRAGRRGGPIVWSAMLVGAAVTLAANVASAPIDPQTGHPDRVAQLMNAWVPLAFLFAVELLVVAFRPGAVGPAPDGDERPSGEPAAAIPDQPTGSVRAGFSTGSSDDELVADLVDWALDRGSPPPRGDVMAAYGIGRGRYDRLRSRLGWANSGPDRSSKRGTER